MISGFSAQKSASAFRREGPETLNSPIDRDASRTFSVRECRLNFIAFAASDAVHVYSYYYWSSVRLSNRPCVVKAALFSAEIPSCLEQPRLARDNDKRPDGGTLAATEGSLFQFQAQLKTFLFEHNYSIRLSLVCTNSCRFSGPLT